MREKPCIDWRGADLSPLSPNLESMNPNPGRRKQLRVLACPVCGTRGLKRILYGMPSDDFEFDQYIVGGCIMSEADIGCVKCDWSGVWEEMT